MTRERYRRTRPPSFRKSIDSEPEGCITGLPYRHRTAPARHPESRRDRADRQGPDGFVLPYKPAISLITGVSHHCAAAYFRTWHAQFVVMTEGRAFPYVRARQGTDACIRRSSRGSGDRVGIGFFCGSRAIRLREPSCLERGSGETHRYRLNPSLSPHGRLHEPWVPFLNSLYNPGPADHLLRCSGERALGALFGLLDGRARAAFSANNRRGPGRVWPQIGSPVISDPYARAISSPGTGGDPGFAVGEEPSGLRSHETDSAGPIAGCRLHLRDSPGAAPSARYWTLLHIRHWASIGKCQDDSRRRRLPSRATKPAPYSLHDQPWWCRSGNWLQPPQIDGRFEIHHAAL